jgi:hypothetical protein
MGTRTADATRGANVKLDKQEVIDLLRNEGKNEHVQKAIEELPDKIDHEQHAGLLTKFGIDPGKLVASAIERGIGSPTNAKTTDSAPPKTSTP